MKALSMPLNNKYLFNAVGLITIVERKTGFLMMRKLNHGKQAEGLAKQLIDMLIPYKNAVLSITSDNGGEFAEHQTISKKLKTDFFFANPYASWERGLNEYTNSKGIPLGQTHQTIYP